MDFVLQLDITQARPRLEKSRIEKLLKSHWAALGLTRGNRFD
jgi:hypothetical protein